LTGNNYGLVMVIGPIFMFIALLMMIGVRRGEAKTREEIHEAFATVIEPE